MPKVAPFVGAWIEIIVKISSTSSSVVAPFVGAWIEMFYQRSVLSVYIVAPFVGAWIEIQLIAKKLPPIKSHPLWVRGLKSFAFPPLITKHQVAPFVGAWIEISLH